MGKGREGGRPGVHVAGVGVDDDLAPGAVGGGEVNVGWIGKVSTVKGALSTGRTMSRVMTRTVSAGSAISACRWLSWAAMTEAGDRAEQGHLVQDEVQAGVGR